MNSGYDKEVVFKGKKGFCCPTGCACCCGIFWLLLGFVIPGFLLGTIDTELDDALTIDSYDDPYYDEWVTTYDEDDVPEYLFAYVWNITNLEGFLAGREKPKLEEVGPYVYRYYMIKYDVSFGDIGTKGKDSGDVSYYRRHKQYFFLPDQPKYPATRNPYTDFVCQVDLIYAGALVADSQQVEQGMRATGRRYFLGEEPNPMISVHDFFFSGAFPIYTNLTLEEFNDPNNYYYEKFRALTNGMYDFERSNNFIEYDELREYTGIWDNYDQPVYGSDGTRFHMHVKHDDVLTSWDPFTVRIYSQYNYDKFTYHLEDIEVMRFFTDRTAYESCDINPNNCKFYHNSPTGFVNLTYYTGIPMFISEAHLYGVDPSVVEMVEGITPTDCNLLHCSVADVMPYTGITVGGGFVGEISVVVGPTTAWYDNLTVMYLPVYWTFEGANITKKLAEDLHLVTDSVALAKDMELSGMILFPFALIAFLYFFRDWHMSNFERKLDLGTTTNEERQPLIQ